VLGRAAATLALAALVAAHVRLLHPETRAPLHWSRPDEVSVVLSARGSDDLAPGMHLSALRSAIEAWNANALSRARLVEDSRWFQQAREDYQSSSIHLVMFDEDDSSGYFPAGSGTVAVTQIWFDGGSRITDADVLFNGAGYRFTTSRQPGRFDVQDVATHELGHLLGLDHSGWAGASLYPYVDPTVILHRSLAMDEVRGLRSMYPRESSATIVGRVAREGAGTPVEGAHVVACDELGRTTGSRLTDRHGRFAIEALEAGTYSVYAAPLDSPVSGGHFGAGRRIETDFEATLFGEVAIGASGDHDLGTRTVGPDVELSLGRVADDYPLRVVRGAEAALVVRGAGLVPGSVLEASAPDVELSAVYWNLSSVQFRIAVPADAALGHIDLTVTAPFGERAVLTAGIEITPPDPVVGAVDPATADVGGGVPVVVQGAGFRPGLRVVIGDRVYAGDDLVLDGPTRVRLVLARTLGGDHDVVVIDPSGVEGRLPLGMRITAQPRIHSVFPRAGSADGGTEVVVVGEDFVPGARVLIDGEPQQDVRVEGPARLRFRTTGGRLQDSLPLVVENPSGTVAVEHFRYLPGPDPRIAVIEPGVGRAAGGQEVQLVGAGFDPYMEVVFGADPDTGEGGAASALVEFLDSTSLVARTPSLGSGPKSVLVRDRLTGRAALLEGAFTYMGPASDGGACAGIVRSAPPDVPSALSGAGWILLAFLLLRWRQRSVRAVGMAIG